jgi:hypothetical protein
MVIACSLLFPLHYMLYNKVIIQDDMVIIVITLMKSYGVPLFFFYGRRTINLKESKEEVCLDVSDCLVHLETHFYIN